MSSVRSEFSEGSPRERRHPRICVVTEADEWAERAIEACREIGMWPERIPWSEAADINGPLDALLVQLDEFPEGKKPAFAAWAEKAWQPCCVVSLAPFRRLSYLLAELDTLGYGRAIHPYHPGTEYWSGLRSGIREILKSPCWMVSDLTRVLGCREPEVVVALAVALEGQPRVRTVKQWASELELDDYRVLEDLFARHRLPAPKRVLEPLRLAAVVDYASGNGLSRDKLAEHFQYASGNYLGKRVKALSGLSFRRVVAMGATEFIVRSRAYLEGSEDRHPK